MSINHTPSAQHLVVDLDGTLIKTDLFFEQTWQLVKSKPHLFFLLVWKSLKSRLEAKTFLVEQTELKPETLPFNALVIERIQEHRRNGSQVHLVSGSPDSWVKSIARHLALFHGAHGSTDINLKGGRKLSFIREKLGSDGFCYAGNDWADVAIWSDAAEIIAVHPNSKLTSRIKKFAKPYHLIENSTSFPKALMKQLRIHQWIKNVLLFLPLIGAHQFLAADRWFEGLVAFFSFSLMASFVYTFNDLSDLEADRRHPTKKKRSLASGNLDIRVGILLLPVLLLGAIGLAWAVNSHFSRWLVIYLGLNLLYSLRLKKVIGLDVILLATMYTIRVMAGGNATSTIVSDWMLSFSTFFFFSLAAVKRSTEIKKQAEGTLPGRGYAPQDYLIVTALGIGAGLLSVLVFLMYLQSEQVRSLYHHPQILWLALPGLLYFVSRLWILVGREQVDDDPVVFTAKDRVSWFIFLYIIAVLALAVR